MDQSPALLSHPDSRRWKALGFIALIQFMLVLDVTVVNVALPRIQTDLHFGRAGLAWVVDGYVLTAGGLLLLGGRLGDLLGRRRMFVGGVLLFAAASALSGSATDPGMLIASRFLQGMGEAVASPAAFGLVALLFTDPRERATAIGIFGGVAGLGGTLGPVISGALISASSWRCPGWSPRAGRIGGRTPPGPTSQERFSARPVWWESFTGSWRPATTRGAPPR